MSEMTQNVGMARLFESSGSKKAPAAIMDKADAESGKAARSFARYLDDISKINTKDELSETEKKRWLAEELGLEAQSGSKSLLDKVNQLIEQTKHSDELDADSDELDAEDADEKKFIAAIEFVKKDPETALGDEQDAWPDDLKGVFVPVANEQGMSEDPEWLDAEQPLQGLKDQLQLVTEQRDELTALADKIKADGALSELDSDEQAQLLALVEWLDDADVQAALDNIGDDLTQLMAELTELVDEQGLSDSISESQLARLEALLESIRETLNAASIEVEHQDLPAAVMPLVQSLTALADDTSLEDMRSSVGSRPTLSEVLRQFSRFDQGNNSNNARAGSDAGLSGSARDGLLSGLLNSAGQNAANNAASQAAPNPAANAVMQLLNERGYNTGLHPAADAAKPGANEDLKTLERSGFAPGNSSGLFASQSAFTAASTPGAGMSNPQTNPQATQQMGQQIQWMVSKGVSRANIELRPADLGSIRIAIETRGDETRIAMTASQANTQGLLEQQLPRLREWLQEAGLAGARIDVRSDNEQAGGNGEMQQEGERDPNADERHPELAGSEELDAQGERLVSVDEYGRVTMQLSLFA